MTSISTSRTVDLDAWELTVWQMWRYQLLNLFTYRPGSCRYCTAVGTYTEDVDGDGPHQGVSSLVPLHHPLLHRPDVPLLSDTRCVEETRLHPSHRRAWGLWQLRRAGVNICNYRCHRYLHAKFQKDWPSKKPYTIVEPWITKQSFCKTWTPSR